MTRNDGRLTRETTAATAKTTTAATAKTTTAATAKKTTAATAKTTTTAKDRPLPPGQLPLPRTGGWGGKRRGAGRKRRDPKRRTDVAHARRPPHKGRHPVHVTLRAKAGLPSFRQQRIHGMLARVLQQQRRRHYKDEFRVVHFSIQSNHIHLVVEADTERALAKRYRSLRSGVSGLAIAFARRLNMMLRRKGKVWADRYHRHDLTTPKETRNAFAYVFANYVRHGWRTFGLGVVDAFSSACMFDGWEGEHWHPVAADRWRWPVCRARTWLARAGYLRHGRLTIIPTR